jgi:hypothetical protein
MIKLANAIQRMRLAQRPCLDGPPTLRPTPGRAPSPRTHASGAAQHALEKVDTPASSASSDSS